MVTRLGYAPDELFNLTASAPYEYITLRSNELLTRKMPFKFHHPVQRTQLDFCSHVVHDMYALFRGCSVPVTLPKKNATKMPTTPFGSARLYHTS